MMDGPLSDIRVIDLSRAIAGPYGSMILGDLGAEIIKIESPEGDLSRLSTGPNHKGESFYYMAFNRNKKDIVLDLGTASGKQAFTTWSENRMWCGITSEQVQYKGLVPTMKR